MKRLIISGPRQAEFQELDVPACPADAVLVRARLTAVSTGTELRVYRAEPVDEAGRFLHETVPFVLPAENGYSMVGEVVEAGADVTGLQRGDRVFVPAAHKEYASVPASLATKLPREIPDEQAVFLNILEVAHKALRRHEPPPGGDVAIVGQGVIGLSLLAYCRAFGMRTAVLDFEPARLEIARSLGAAASLSPEEPDHLERIVDLFGGAGADVAYEAASSWEGIRTAMQLARVEGTVVVVSRITHAPDFNPVGHPFLGKKLSLLTSYGHQPDGSRWDRARSFALTLEMLARGRLDIAPMITHHFRAEELPEVYRRLDEGERSMVGVVLAWK